MNNTSHKYTPLQQAIINALLYFDVFKYPLKREEIFQNLSVKTDIDEFNVNLNTLIESEDIKQQNGFYFVNSINELYIEKRIKANELAVKKMQMAYKCSKFISKFPFIKAVCISGSLSKNYYDEHSDIDYFVVTTKNRLWICRTIFTIFYKLLPKNKKEFYCINYYVAEHQLHIPDQNHFVASELAYLVPTVNYDTYNDLININKWYSHFLPNYITRNSTHSLSLNKPVITIIIEKICSLNIVNHIDNWLLKKTLEHWRKKFPLMRQQDFDLQYRTRKDVCKRHSFGHQNKVLQIWEEKKLEYYHNKKIVI